VVQGILNTCVTSPKEKVQLTGTMPNETKVISLNHLSSSCVNISKKKKKCDLLT
jgi:hypothetical protein